MKHFGSTSGLTTLAEDQATPSNGMIAYTTSDYNTGWMNGDIKGAFLSDTDDTDLVGGTDADRSVNGNDLTVNGTVTRSAVATGAELVEYGGFSASNYLEQPYNSDLDFGTGDYCYMGWLQPNSDGASANMVSRQDPTGTGSGNGYYITLGAHPSAGDFRFRFGTGDLYSGVTSKAGVWSFLCATRKDGVVYFYVDGVLTGSAANTDNVDNTSAKLFLGALYWNEGFADSNGNIALVRVSATAPTAEQVAKIYNDEKFLFQENAAATLYGTSDAVTALAHDSDTNLLHVGTSDGRSTFQGLRRVSNTTTAVETAISASNGLVVEE